MKLKSDTRGAKEIIGTIRLEENLGLNKSKSFKVAIIGGGISGLCSALFLKQLGCKITVFEKEKFLKSEGAGIQLTSNGLFVLEKLNLGRLAVEAGLKPNNLCLFDEADFKSIGSLEILNRSKARYGRSFITLHRSFLVNMLFEKVKEEKEINFPSLNLDIIPPFYKNPKYIEILSAKIEESIKNVEYDHLLFSYHGIPVSHLKISDTTNSPVSYTHLTLPTNREV